MPFGTLRSLGRIWEFKRFITKTSMIVMIFALTGCGLFPVGDKAPPYAPAPPIQTEIQQQSAPYASSPEGYEQIPAPLPSVTPMDPIIATGPLQLGPEGSSGSLGLNLDEYFDKDADMPIRIRRVERAVTAIQTDLKTLLPPIKRLITVERDIQELISQLTVLTQKQSSPAAKRVTAKMIPAALTPQSLYKPPPPAKNTPTKNTTYAHQTAPPSLNHVSGGYQALAVKGPATVRHLRIGEHSTKTRIVLDISGPTSYRYDLDNEENLLIIELPHAGWSGKTQWKSGKSPLLASYNVYKTESGGSRVVLQLKKGTQVIYETVIKAKSNENYRIVLDLKK